LVLGTFVIPGTYGAKHAVDRELLAGRGGPVPSSGKELGGTARLGGRVFDEVGEAVDGAIVSLAGSGFWPARSVESGPDGRFVWRDVPAGVYELRVSKGRLVAPPLEGLILDAGARRQFGVRLALGWTLIGKVVDADSGRPVTGADVTVATGALGLHTREAVTGPQGRFEVEGVVGSEQSLYVDADGYVIAGPLVQTEDGVPIVVRLERAARIEGRVVDEAGWPIPNAMVRAFGDEANAPQTVGDSLAVTDGPVPPISAAAGSGLAFVGQMRSDRDGGFQLENLRPGTYTVAVSHGEHAPKESEPIRLNAGETRRGVRIAMEPGAELIGRVVDERGFGLEAIPVELRAASEREPRMAVTADDGSFAFGGVRGEVEVVALPYDLPATRETATVEPGSRVVVELALATTLNTLRGQVVDDRGFGVSGALLTVTSADPAKIIRRSAKSDIDGTFSVPALPDPPYAITVEHSAYSTTRIGGVEEIDDLRIELAAGVTLIGEVLDDWTGEGLPGARIGLEGESDAHTRTRGDGTFVFRQLRTGTYDISLTHPDYEAQARRVVLEPPRYVDRPQELETVRLEPGGVVQGEVFDASSDPVAGAEVAWGDPPRWDRAARTDAAGRFRLRGVSPGTQWITARHEQAGEDSTLEPILVRPLETSPGALVRLPGVAQE
jgi:protocatechuate 3,4-dioxygenase beta subunit